MKLQDLIIRISLAFITAWIFNYFFFPQNIKEGENKISGQQYQAPEKPEIEVHKPLKTTIDFLQAKPSRKTVLTTINTDNARYEFSNDGAIISRLEFYRNWGGKEGYLGTIFPPAADQKERGSFLIAFDEKTPFYFDLVENKEEDDRFILTYKVSLPQGELFKIYTIYKKVHRLDLKLSINLQAGAVPLTPRIFFSSPLISDLVNEDVISGIINKGSQSIKTVTINEKTAHSYWVAPSLFGSQDRYFVHSLVEDHNYFTQRAYFNLATITGLSSILEGPEINESTSWDLTFYLGPKEDEAMNAVDKRLENTINYGWFAFLSKPLSKLLLAILNFFHRYTGNYGIAIVLITIFIRILMLPFTFHAERGMKQREEFQKKLQHIQAKYKNDPQSFTQARNELLQKHGMSGMFGGCLPMLLQLPIFWALSIVLSHAIELYKSPFLWIHDLSAPDPYYLFPLLMTVGTIVTAQTIDKQQRIVMVIMAIFLGAVFSTFSAGFTLYFALTTYLGFFQTFITKRLRL